MFSRHIWFDKDESLVSLKPQTWLLVSKMRLIIMIHFTLLNIKILYIDIIESLTQKSKNIPLVITLILLFTRL